MTIRTSTPLGAPTWIDLLTSDLDRAKDFYGTVFGWTFESAGPEHGGYVTASKDRWTTYVHSADVAAREPTEIKDKGSMATLTDPTGASSRSGSPTATTASRS